MKYFILKILLKLKIISIETNTFEEYLKYAFSIDIYIDAPLILIVPYEVEIIEKLKNDIDNLKLLEDIYKDKKLKKIRENLSNIYNDIYRRDLTVNGALRKIANSQKDFYIVS